MSISKVTNPFLAPKQHAQIHGQLITALNPQLLTSLLRALVLSNSPHEALCLYTKMLHHGSTCPDHFTHVHALKACSLLHAFHKARQIHTYILKSGNDSNILIQNSLIRIYADAGDLAAAKQVFNAVSLPNVVSWTSLISGLSRSGHEKDAILAFSSMNVRPNELTLVSILSACSRLRAMRWGRTIHGHSLRAFTATNTFVGNAILEMYMKCGCLDSARKMFGSMTERDVVSWTTMVAGFAQNNCSEEAITIFQMMLHDGKIEPNEATLVSVLSACSSLGTICVGRWVHAYLDKRQLWIDGNMGNALLNMYAKCGDMSSALEVFRGISHKDLVSWSTIIGGMAMNGYGMCALQLFSSMLCHGVHPDNVIFIGVLSACSHAGLVDHGVQIFIVMQKTYNIVPKKVHYACMVDLFSRAGLLEEAEAFIMGMPIKADGEIWGSLLNASKIHGNEKIGERVRQHLLSVRPSCGGTYALLSNTFANIDRWQDANHVRESMKCLGIKKIPGFSWIEVD